MISDPFDSGPTGAFRTLCQKYPDDTVYTGADGFRSLWGPIFYRGRADGTARLLVIGQDPAQTEAVTRRILSGQAGRRVQGFVEKLGFSKSYLMINAFVYGIFNQSMALPHLNDPEVQAYRHKWLEAALAPGKIEAVVTFGNPAFNAWTAFKATPAGQSVTAFHHRALHPTADKPGGPITRKDLCRVRSRSRAARAAVAHRGGWGRGRAGAREGALAGRGARPAGGGARVARTDCRGGGCG